MAAKRNVIASIVDEAAFWAFVALMIAFIALGASAAQADESPALFFVRQDAAARMAHLHPHHVVARPRLHGRATHGDLLRGVTPPLAAKAREIVRACGSSIVSGVRYTRVAGSRRLSLHASGRAVDLRGNPSCIYARLRGWPGGYSTDYWRVAHVHVSWGGREAGLRFAHARPLRLASR